MRTVVAALGGNALARRGEALDFETQRANAKVAAEALGHVARDHRLVVTHGNGPQVGLLALQSAAAEPCGYSLDVLDAETEGMLGYLLEQELGGHVPRDRLATLLTQVLVDPNDPAFAEPTKPIGPVYDRDEATALAEARGWQVRPDGDGWRRVVASPEPRGFVELATIELLVEHGVTVICTGGGGIPVVPGRGGGLHGVEAVVDKDLAASLLASELGADVLLLLTDVDGVYEAWGTTDARRLPLLDPVSARALRLPSGSMRPKVDAATRFVERGGQLAVIGSLEDAPRLLEGGAGTAVRRLT
jgi:carbamate kinase